MRSRLRTVRSVRQVCNGVLLVLGCAGPVTVLAQQATGLEEIVVTAQRREETAQKAALSIDVYGAEALRDLGVTRPDDLIRVAPGLQVGGGTTTQLYVRGVGDFGVIATANPAVATSIDGVGISRPQAISGNFFDLARVELLKGPQGTLYGRNASGGALNLLTVQPKLGEYSGYVEGSVANYDAYGLEGAFNVPAGEDLAFRLSYQVADRDGYLSDGADDDEHESVRFQTRYESGALSLRAQLGYIHLGGVGTGMVRIPELPGTSPWTGNTSQVAGDAYLQAAAANYIASGGASPPPFLLANPASSELFQDVDNYNAQLQFDYAFDAATLTVIPAYRRTEARFAIQPSFLYNVGGAYNAAGDRVDGETSDQSSLEVRVANETDKLKWVLGAYAFKEDQSTDFALQGGMILNVREIMDLETQALAAFGQLTYSVTDRLRLTGGLRHTSDERSASDFQRYGISPMVLGPAPSPIDCVPANGAAPGTLCPLFNPTPGFYDSSATFNKLTWKAGFEFDLAPQSLLFADVSTGFKAGGFNMAVSLTNPGSLEPFDPEEVTAYTAGVKSRFLDNTLQLNVEGFYLDYQDMQLSAQAFDGDHAIVLLTQNAGEATIAGANVNMVLKAWTGATIRASAEYVDSEYDEFLIHQLAMFVPPGRVACPVSAPDGLGIVTIDCSGKPLVRTPEWSGAFGFTQEFDLAGGGQVAFNSDVIYADERYLATDFIDAQLADSYINVSASLTYYAPDRKWFVSAFGRNLTDEVIYTGGGGHQSGFVTGWMTTNIAPPRTYGVRFGLNF